MPPAYRCRPMRSPRWAREEAQGDGELNGYTYRSTVAAYGDVFMLPLSAAHRAAAGVKAGDAVEVTIELDTAPRTVEAPADLAAALAAQPGAAAAFDALSYYDPQGICPAG